MISKHFIILLFDNFLVGQCKKKRLATINLNQLRYMEKRYDEKKLSSVVRGPGSKFCLDASCIQWAKGLDGKAPPAPKQGDYK